MKMKKTCVLSELPSGCRAKVSGVEGCGDLRARLGAMGFTPEAELEVIECACGKQLVKIRGGTMILDDNTACRITCSSDSPNERPCKTEGLQNRIRRGLRRLSRDLANCHKA